MKSPNSPAALEAAIESLVASYLGEVRVAAQRAVERGFAQPALAARSTKNARSQPTTRAAGTTPRSPSELAAISQALDKLVRARPGELMAVLAAEMGTTASALYGPMAKLRAAGRVRSVGQRHLTRYFPAVSRIANTQ